MPIQKSIPTLAPNCEYGYVENQLNVLLNGGVEEFYRWAEGQTFVICDGRCGRGGTHGKVILASMLHRYLANLSSLA